MILIISDFFDYSTQQVIEWLDYLKKDWFRINMDDEIEIDFVGDDIIFKNKNKSLKLSEVNSCWYRRGHINYKNKCSTQVSQFDKLQYEELEILMQFIYYKLEKIKCINSIININANKLIISDIARELDIKTPNDMIFNDSIFIHNLIDRQQSYITKVMSGNCNQKFNSFEIVNYTSILDIDKISQGSFFPSLIQNLITKKYELRIFYLNGDFYSMAIFSQNEEQTSIDFRNYNEKNINRNVPFRLPKEIQVKLNLLMNKLQLNSGSIDMIVTPENEYIFLEVNPVGQFGMVSYPCNYNLEEKIAQYL